MRRLILLVALAGLLTGCNVVIKGDKFTLYTAVDGIPARVEMENFEMTIPVATMYAPEPKQRNTAVEVMLQ